MLYKRTTTTNKKSPRNITTPMIKTPPPTSTVSKSDPATPTTKKARDPWGASLTAQTHIINKAIYSYPQSGDGPTAKILCDITGLGDRRVRNHIHYLRRKGLINNSNLLTETALELLG